LLAHSKIELYRQLLASDVLDDGYLVWMLQGYFPEPVGTRFAAQVGRHPLRREIIATCLTNNVVDHGGISFVFRLAEETGRDAPEIARAHTAAAEIFTLTALWTQIRALDGVVATNVQTNLFLEVRRVVERATRRLLRERLQPLDIAAAVAFFAPAVPALRERLPKLLTDSAAAELARASDHYVHLGVPDTLARHIAALPALFAALDINQIANSTGQSLADTAAGYFQLGEQLRLDWLRDRILELPRDEHWEALARGALRDTLNLTHATLTAEVLRGIEPNTSIAAHLRGWLAHPTRGATRCVSILDEIADSGRADLATLTVALQAVGTLSLSQTEQSSVGNPPEGSYSAGV
jgi:glutamate dehydrogenase